MTMAWAGVPAPAPIRQLTVGVTEVGVAHVAFGADPRRLASAARRMGCRLVVDRQRTDPAAAELGEYLAGQRRRFTVAVDWSLTSGVQRSVLSTLYDQVGHGETTTYGELARLSRAFEDGNDQRARGAQAVGSIMGSNPLPLIVPCHRVLAADGLGGFGGGLEVKRWLLALEGVLTLALDLDAVPSLGSAPLRPPHRR